VNIDDGYTVTAMSDSDNYDDPANEANVIVKIGTTAEDVNFSFTRETGGMNGTVVASGDTVSTTQSPGTGEGIENATVEVYTFQSDDSGSANFTFENVTDASGAFDLSDDMLLVGDQFVVVSATNFSSIGLNVIVSEGSKDLGKTALYYADGGQISGELSLSPSDPNEEVTVNVTATDSDGTLSDSVIFSGNSTSYTIESVDLDVDAGYIVTAEITSNNNYNSSTSAEITGVAVDVNADNGGNNFSFDRLTGIVDGNVAPSGDVQATQSGIEDATVERYTFEGTATFNPNTEPEFSTNTDRTGSHGFGIPAERGTRASGYHTRVRTERR
jgi:hypothetical protein